MALLTLTMAAVSLAKASGAFIVLSIANDLFHIAIERGGLYVFLYVAALYLVIIAAYCIYESAVEFYEILQQAFIEEDDTSL